MEILIIFAFMIFSLFNLIVLKYEIFYQKTMRCVGVWGMI
jgi:hypothetical protein